MVNKTALSAVFICIALLMISLCSAQQVEEIVLRSTPIINKVLPGEWAKFSVTLTNQQDRTDRFHLSIAEEGIEFSSLAEPLSDLSSGIELVPGESKEFIYKLKPREDLVRSSSKPYKVRLSAESLESNKLGSTILQVFIIEDEPEEPIVIVYESDINVSLNIPTLIDPRRIYSFKIDLKNNNPKDIQELNVELRSVSINKDAKIELGPEVKKTVAFTVGFDEIRPMKDALDVIITDGNRTLYKTTIPIEIVSYEILFKTEKEVVNEFLKKTEIITFTNEEAVESQQLVKIETISRDRFFAETQPKSEIIEEDGNKYYAWNIGLKPGESFEIRIISNQRWIIFLLLAVVIMAMIAYMFRNPVTIVKEADNIIAQDGGINEIKVILNIRNRSNRSFDNVKILDKVPKIAGLDKSQDVGTLKPSKVSQRANGSILQWDIENMEGKEERIITYSFKSKLGIIGDMRLPPAVVIMKVGSAKVKIKSNELDITSSE